MKLMTTLELANKDEHELAALFCAISKGLVMTKRGTPQRRNALATLENINRQRCVKLAHPGL